jgi:uroporphyrinogen decarboxylase
MSNWNKRQRLEATINGEAPDRVPVALWRHWPGDDQDAHALAAAHLKWQQDYDWDLLKVGPASSYSVVDWGVKDEWLGHIEGTRQYTYRPIQQPEDWAKLQPLDPSQGMLATQLESLRLVKEAVGDTVPVLATIFAPLSQARHLADSEPMLNHMRSQPELFRQGQEAIVESTLRYIEAAKNLGIDGIFYAIQHARYPLLGQEEYEIWGRPYDRQILDEAQDLWFNMVHLHSTDVMFDLVAQYPAQLLNWHDRETGITLATGLQQFQGAASGGVDHWTLHQESPEQTLAEVQDAINQTNGRRLLLGTGCVVMTTTPLRNIRALRESVDQ